MIMIWQGAAIGVMMEMQLAVMTPTTAARGSMPIRIQAEVTSGMKIVRVARLDMTCVRMKGTRKNTSMMMYGFVVLPSRRIIQSATTSPAPVVWMASDSASTPANRKMVGWWMEFRASFSLRTPESTSATAPRQAVRYILMPMTFSRSISRMVARMMTTASLLLNGLSFSVSAAV